ILPFPVELLRFLEKSTPQSSPQADKPKIPDDPRSLLP
ncbi:MAG: hypothetical protein QOC62_1854, partial [Mycobacterium sp.]|nr:hypothetical protein [Mycobacterium sp.]